MLTIRNWKHNAQLIVGALLLVLMFLQIVAWLSSQPISDLPPEIEAPEWAKSFHTKRGGDLEFNYFGTISEEPVRFSVLLVLFLAVFAYLVVSDRKFRSRSSGPPRE